MVRRCSSAVEQGFRKAKVGGSNPSNGTTLRSFGASGGGPSKIILSPIARDRLLASLETW